MFRKSKDAARNPSNRRQVKLLGGFAAGVIGGIVATWALDKFQLGAMEATRRAEDAANAQPFLSRQQEDERRRQLRAHAEAAERLARSTTGKGLSRAQRQSAVPIVHYAAGALAGGAYGLAAEILPVVRRGYGTGYANLVFLGGSEALLPWLGISPKQQPQITPAGLPAPLVFGAVLEATRRLVRWML
jgi:hypothetical protein